VVPAVAVVEEGPKNAKLPPNFSVFNCEFDDVSRIGNAAQSESARNCIFRLGGF
jgi:hypothetical protein